MNIPNTESRFRQRGTRPALLALLLGIATGPLAGWTATADEVTDWNQNMLQAALAAKTSPLVTTRVAAIVQAAVFDALNGIERRYMPVHVTTGCVPPGGSGSGRLCQFGEIVSCAKRHARCPTCRVPGSD